MNKLCNFLFIVCVTCANYAQIKVDATSRNAQQLVEEVLLKKGCAKTSNWRMASGSAAEQNFGVGYFNSNGADFPFEEGIVLSTSKVSSIPGPNDEDLSDGIDDDTWGDDADLRNVLNLVTDELLHNRSYLEFDFVPKSDHLSVRFFMASEEYTDTFPCSYSDVFAFIVTHPDGTKENIALIPDTNIPIQVVSIHKEVISFPVWEGCPAENEQYFAGHNPIDSPIDFNGQTVVFTANAKVIPNESYHMKLIIADYTDRKFDSAVFIESGSFNIGVDLGDDQLIKSEKPVCGQTQLNGEVVGAKNYKWFKNNQSLADLEGKSKVVIPDNALYGSGVYKVIVDMGDNCLLEDDVKITFERPPMIASPPLDLESCFLTNNQALFNLKENESRMLGDLSSNAYGFAYFLTQKDAEENRNPIENPSKFLSGDKTIFVRMFFSNDCFELTSFTLKVNTSDITADLPKTHLLCLDSTGAAKEELILQLTGNILPEYTIQWFKGKEVSESNKISGANSKLFKVSELGFYTVEITDSKSCTKVLTTEVKPIKPPEKVAFKSSFDCVKKVHQINVQTLGDGTYLYRLNNGEFQSKNQFSNLNSGSYTITIKDNKSCFEETKQLQLKAVDLSKISEIKSTGELCENTGSSGFKGLKLNIDGYDKDGLYSFQWYRGETTSAMLPIAGANAFDLQVNLPGWYKLRVKDAINNCFVERIKKVEVKGLTSSVEIDKIYDCSQERFRLKVSVQGEGLYRYRLNNGVFQEQAEFDSMLPGKHNITVQHESGCFQKTLLVDLEKVDLSAFGPIKKPGVLCVDADGNALVPIKLSLEKTGSNKVSYQWFNGRGVASGTSIIGENKGILEVKNSGYYTLQITDEINKCVTERIALVEALGPPKTLHVEVQKGNFLNCAYRVYGLRVKVEGDSNYTMRINGGKFQPIKDVKGLSSGNYVLDIEDELGCFKRQFKLDLKEERLAEVPQLPNNLKICDTKNEENFVWIEIPEFANLDQYSFQWYTGAQAHEDKLIDKEVASKLKVFSPGAYTVRIVHKESNCSWDRVVRVLESQPPLSFKVNLLNKVFEDKNNIEVIAVGGTDLEYAIDDKDFQDSNIFNAVLPGLHIVKVRDKLGCVELQKSIPIIGYPKFFTPNGDGVNDHWRILGASGLQNYEVFIFDRYGKLLRRLVKGGVESWTGLFEGKPLLESDYWFRMLYQVDNKENQELKGHFSLVR